MSRQKVLIVDDEDTIRHALRRMLRPLEVDTLEAANGIGALAVFEEQQPDLILLDIVMPRLNGLEVCRKLKADPKSRMTPVILVTSSSSPDNKMRGIEAGADDFITKPFDRAELVARVRSLLRMKNYTDELEEAETVLLALARAIEGKDPCTEGHCERLSLYAQKVAIALGLPGEEVTALRRAGIVHDVGKVAVPEAILLKIGPLTDDEWKVMRKHPEVGERICEGLRSFKLVLPIIRHHHEKLDGSGYPDGLYGEQIPRTARILTIVDVYDALTTKRPYKDGFPPDRAMSIMQEEVGNGWWDPEIFGVFRNIVQREGFAAAEAEAAKAFRMLVQT